MSTDPDPQWEAFAAREPYFAVLTAPKFLRANLTPAHELAFFDSGETLVDWTFRTIELRLIPQFAPMSVLEYGCGVGRLAIPFAERAGTVVAVDRSPAMLDAARHEAALRGITQIEFRTPTELFTKPHRFDLVNCYLVFQRMPPHAGLALLRDMLGCLGAGGVGVFHFPYRTTTSSVVGASRWLRTRMPGVNGIANVLRGKPFGDPLLVSHPYDLDDVFRVIEEAEIDATYVAFERHEGLAGVILFVQAPGSYTTAVVDAEAPASLPPPGSRDRDADRTISVSDLISRTSIEELNRTAEAYFASLSDWDHHLAKPFSKPNETPPLLIDVAILLQGLELMPGSTVLEFGAGTGWLARFVTQLGCRVILLDVSPTALRIARELYDRLPVIGDRPQPEFLTFDGATIDLPDASVDRIVSFHAFHHAPNPDAVLRELGRVLKPGGIAAFAEPGPRHSETPLSQFEMRTYGVVENDVDVHAIWRTAKECGFDDLKLALFHRPPFHASLEEYEDFLAGGPTCAQWVASTRGFLRYVRAFFLFKAGEARADSRAVAGLASEIDAVTAGRQVKEGHPIVIEATVRNTGTAVWLPSDVARGGVKLGAHLYDASRQLIEFNAATQSLTDPPREMAPGEAVAVRLTLPPQRTGAYLVELDCVASQTIWFSQMGSRTASVRIDVVPGTAA